MSDSGMVVIGAGKAGARAVVGLREHGWKGAITLIGEEEYAPYDRPPLSKSAIVAAADPEPAFILDATMLASLGVTFIAGVAAVDVARREKSVVLADGQRIRYQRLLIATGARARRLPAAEHALTLRDLADSRALRAAFLPERRIVIIGGGFIGLELAASATTRGAMVTVIETQPRVLMRGVCATVAQAVAARHASAGVTIITGASIAAVGRSAVLLKDGRQFEADAVVAGIGARPEITLAEAAGLAIDNGIACDENLRTSDPDIFAAGDCCSFPHWLYGGRRIRLEAWRAAQDHGAVAAENMLGGARRFEAVPWFWSDHYELTLQIAGLPGSGVSTATRTLKDDAFIEFEFDHDGHLISASGLGRGNVIARDIRLAEMLIAKRARPDPSSLANADVALRSLLAAAA